MPQETAPAGPTKGAIVFMSLAKGFDTIGLGIKYGAYVYIARYAYFSLSELAGKTTVANFVFQYLTSKEGSGHIAPWLCTGASLIWGYTERHLRLKKIAAMGTHNAELERRLDLNRSSSRLTIQGETGPGDHL